MTFVLDPDCYQHFFSSESVDFKAAVFPVVNKVGEYLHSNYFQVYDYVLNYIAGVSGEDFFKYHMTCHESLKGRFSSTTATLCPVMCKEFYSSFSSYEQTGEKEMYDFVQEAMFEAITRELFGRDNVPKDKVGCVAMYHGVHGHANLDSNIVTVDLYCWYGLLVWTGGMV